MTPFLAVHPVQDIASIRTTIDSVLDDLIASLPDPKTLNREERRGIMARYTAVLEGNFIYWMTATYLSVRSEAARPILLDNLREEVGDCHPAMLRRFAMEAHSFPRDTDGLAVHCELTSVRLFVGRLWGPQSVLMMAFFEGFIQRLMPWLADLALAEGSAEMEYTDVHGVCDIAHTQGLFLALASEMAMNPPDPTKDLFEGVTLLRALLQKIVHDGADKHVVA
jgi:hypothetical protein